MIIAGGGNMAKYQKKKVQLHTFEEKAKAFADKVRPVWQWVYRLRGLILSIPIAAAAVIIALHNQIVLPDMVGLNMQSNGEFAMMVTRNYAVFGPLLVTGFCLLLMFCSRKTLFPWIISIFSLVLPYLIYLTNM